MSSNPESTASDTGKGPDAIAIPQQKNACPIHRLDADVLVIVFLYILRADLFKTRHRGSNVPWLLANVCRRWREVTLSDSRLWAWPVISSFLPEHVPQITTQLLRSGDAKLHVQLYEHKSANNLQLPALLELSRRWASACIYLSADEQDEHLLSALSDLEGTFDQLEELEVGALHGATLDVFAIAPKLQILSLSNVSEPAQSLVLPWHQLRKYRGIANPWEHLGVLSLCPNLVCIDLVCHDHFFSAPVKRIPLPRLRGLYVDDSGVLNFLLLPALEEVTIEGWATKDPLLPLLKLLQQDQPPLASVSLRRGPLILATIAAILEENSSITTLRLRLEKESCEALNALVAQLKICADDTSTSYFAPNLTALQIDGPCSPFDWDQFIDVMETRRNPKFDVCRSLEAVQLRDLKRSEQLTQWAADIDEFWLSGAAGGTDGKSPVIDLTKPSGFLNLIRSGGTDGNSPSIDLTKLPGYPELMESRKNVGQLIELAKARESLQMERLEELGLRLSTSQPMTFNFLWPLNPFSMFPPWHN
ncbi:hypothetical protein C8J57DRAFT_1626975 [Mycena rebaudengoi]|nr:hypothetical protein C8J57DRAFT_1626975 [Mycena rebaudengoi]